MQGVRCHFILLVKNPTKLEVTSRYYHSWLYWDDKQQQNMQNKLQKLNIRFRSQQEQKNKEKIMWNNKKLFPAEKA